MVAGEIHHTGNGQIIRGNRKRLGVTQKDLALTSGTGLRFIIDLEKGKETCQIGKVLTVLQTLGIRIALTPACGLRERGIAHGENPGCLLARELVGHLIQNDGGQMVFDYAENWLQKPDATPLSHSLPLRRKRLYSQGMPRVLRRRSARRKQREIIARNLGISGRNDYAMLERIGGECAGAVTFIPAGESLPARTTITGRFRRLSWLEYSGNYRRPSAAGWRDRHSPFRLPVHRTRYAVRIVGEGHLAPSGRAHIQ